MAKEKPKQPKAKTKAPATPKIGTVDKDGYTYVGQGTWVRRH